MANTRLWMIRRPLYIFAAFFLTTTAVLVWRGEHFGLQTAAIAALALILVLCIPPLRQLPLLRIAPLAILLAALLLYTRSQLFQPLQEKANQTVSVTVRITAVPEPSSRLYRGIVVDSDGLPEDTRLCFSFADPAMVPELYETVQGKARLYLPSTQMNSLRSEDIYLSAYFTEAAITGKTSRWYEQCIQSLRRTLLSGIHGILPGDEGELLAAVTFGDTSSLSESVENNFRNSGLSHLLVVSGLHMTILTAAVSSLVRPFRRHRFLSILPVLAVLWVFMLLVGFSYSVIRAGIMIHFVLIGRSFRFRADTRTSLSAALLFILMLNPYAVADVGFLLSFAATLGMIVLTPVLEDIIGTIPLCRRHEWLRKFLAVLCGPLAAMAFTAPILGFYFGRLAVLTPISNLLAVWPVTILLPLSALGALFVCLPFGGGIARGFLFCAGLLAKWVLAVARWIGRLPSANWQIRYPVLLILLTLLPIAMYWGWKLQRRRGLRRTLAAGMVLILLSGIFFTLFSRHTFSFRLAESEGSLTAVFETGGHTMALISGEDISAFYDARSFLSDCGVKKLDFLVITDGSAKVTASLAQLLTQYPAETVIYVQDGADWTAGISGIRREPVQETATFTFWNRAALSLQDGWWRADFGDTRFLFAPAEKTEIPIGWDNTHVAVFRREVPPQASALHTQQALVLCAQRQIYSLTTQLPWGSYPIDFMIQTGDFAFLTAGHGDLTAANRYWL